MITILNKDFSNSVGKKPSAGGEEPSIRSSVDKSLLLNATKLTFPWGGIGKRESLQGSHPKGGTLGSFDHGGDHLFKIDGGFSIQCRVAVDPCLADIAPTTGADRGECAGAKSQKILSRPVSGVVQ
jgi:hypothetical protein